MGRHAPPNHEEKLCFILKRAARIILLTVLVICGFIGIVSIHTRPLSTEVGFHAGHRRGLPEDASDISFSENRMRSMYAFEIPEAGLNAWVKARGFIDLGCVVRGERITSASHIIHFRFDADPSVDVDITDGLWMENRPDDGGGHTVAFDRTTGMGYYERSVT